MDNIQWEEMSANYPEMVTAIRNHLHNNSFQNFGGNVVMQQAAPAQTSPAVDCNKILSDLSYWSTIVTQVAHGGAMPDGLLYPSLRISYQNAYSKYFNSPCHKNSTVAEFVFPNGWDNRPIVVKKPIVTSSRNAAPTQGLISRV